jgi:phenylalanyl-tRNA synthetase alpha chain
MGQMSPEERQAKGPQIHSLREAVTTALADRKAALESAASKRASRPKRWTCRCPRPKRRAARSTRSQVMDELAEIFADMGFAVASGPEIEDDWHNFTALNMPETHPARAMHDTFYFPDKDAEGRDMLRARIPRRCRSARCSQGARRCASSRRAGSTLGQRRHAHPMFHQIEGLVIDKGIHLGHLKWTLETSSRRSSSATTSSCACAPAISRSPSLRWKWTWAIPW